MKSEIIAENGYVIIAVNPIEYRQAQCCAFSIKSKMPNASVTLIVPDQKKVAKNYLHGFDAITELPFRQSTNCRQNDWQLYWCSPYENTIALDCKTLIKSNQDSIWEYLIDHCSIAFPTTVNDIRQNKIYPKYQGYLQSEYKLDVVYSNMFFFKKDEEALKHFKMADVYFEFWKDVCSKFLEPQHIPDFFDADTMHTLVANHSGCDVTVPHEILNYIDMKYTMTTGALGKVSKWTQKLNVWPSNSGKIKIQNYAINSVIYYHENEFLTEEMFNEQESYYNTISK